MNDNRFARVSGGGPRRTAKARRIPVSPVPADAPSPPSAHPQLGKPSATWIYANATGAVLGYALRFDRPEGKQFRPLTLWQSADGLKPEWRWESWPPKRPLYGLPRLAERPGAPVLVCEGEKSADAATGLLPGFVAVTSPNGSKSAGKADWSPLRRRAVIIWPDADAAGLAYARQVAKLVIAAGAASVAIVAPPPDCKTGWDTADAVADGWDEEGAMDLVGAAKSAASEDSNAGEAKADRNKRTKRGASGRRQRPRQQDTLIGLTELCEFWHDANRNAYVTFIVNGHCEHWPVRSHEFRMWLSGRFYEATGGAIGSQILEDGLRILEARALYDAPEHEPFIRVGRYDDKLYLDLCDARWRLVEITPGSWSVVANPPLKFLRSSSMRPLPEPQHGGMIEELRGFLNVSDDGFVLVVAWLVAALRERGPYPVLVVNGEQGTGKSVFSRMIRSLIDPSAAPIRAVPKDERDLVVSASRSWALAFDNLSGVPVWFADALARLSTGSGFTTRMLHTDRDEFIFAGSRPIVLNGIASLTDRADLADRAVTIHLAVIPDTARQPEDEIFAGFEAKRPLILGALLDAVSVALRKLPTVKLDRAPRMADFAKWVTAAEPGLGWEHGAFLDAYNQNRRDAVESSFEADSVAVAIRDFILTEHPDRWTGTPTQLLSALNSRVSDDERKSRNWADTPQRLGNRIDRVAPLLRSKGFAVQRHHSGQRFITIVPPKNS